MAVRTVHHWIINALIFCWITGMAAGSFAVHYQLRLSLQPGTGVLNGRCKVRVIGTGGETVQLMLHRALEISSVRVQDQPVTWNGSAENQQTPARLPEAWRQPLQQFSRMIEIPLPPGVKGPVEIELVYAGRLPALENGTLPAPPAPVISSQAIILPPGSGWYPWSIDPATFAITVEIPAQFHYATAGVPGPDGMQDGNRITTWQESRPVPPAGLIGGDSGKLALTVLDTAKALIAPSPPAAAMQQILSPLVAMFGPYPFPRLALAESPRPEEAWSSPSLLVAGRRRLAPPDGPDGFFRHHLLHGWFGQAVPDPAANWSEGLATWLADHNELESRKPGQAAMLRRLMLERTETGTSGCVFTDTGASHFRHVLAAGRPMLLVHMLSTLTGHDIFQEAIKRLPAELMGKTTGWRQFLQFVESVYKEKYARALKEKEARGIRLTPDERNKDLSLEWFGQQWLDNLRLPELRATFRNIFHPTTSQYMVGFQLTQPDPPFILQLPLVIECSGRNERRWVKLDRLSREYQIMTSLEPKFIHIDPEWDILRQLDPAERIPVLDGWPAARTISHTSLPPAWREVFTSIWPDIDLRLLEEERLPGPADHWLRVAAPAQLLSGPWREFLGEHIRIEPGTVTVGGERLSLTGRTVALTVQIPGRTGTGLLILTDDPGNVPPDLLRLLSINPECSWLAWQGGRLLESGLYKSSPASLRMAVELP